MTSQETTTATGTGFTSGEHVVLRPVLESDLAQLAPLLAANPSEPERLPWTQHKLKQKYEDEKDPGLWGNKLRVFAVVRRQDGELVGYLRELDEWGSGNPACHFHLADGLADRDQLGTDLLLAFMDYKRRWSDPLRIGFNILGCEEDKARWLEAAGFELELRRERMYMHLGQPQALLSYAWLSERLKQELVRRGESEQQGAK